ncbi:hypothetical protein C8Q80DRAFT_1269887 [Daedaleopsis nitida]|nr:hypothetical protein C8Q80DRAFT_1269887 [Daedaleopsis nitida]
MAHAWDLYAKGLMPLGYGYPLWGPEPDPTYGEVRLGDVGYIQDGHFCFLFNAMRDAGDPINKDGVPDPFEAFTPPVSTTIHRPDEITQSQLHSRSLQSISVSTTASARCVSGGSFNDEANEERSSELGAAATAGLRFQCSEETGALLMLKQPAHKTYLNCAVHIRQYIRNHLSSWCDFANQIRGIGLQEKDIIFISGHTKTSVWAEAAFHHSNSNGELVIGGSCFVPSVSGEFRVSMSRCTDATVFSRYGPRELVSSWSDDPTALPCMPKCQQSIFVNYYKMKTRRWPLRHTVIRAAAGPHELPDDDEDDDPSTGTPESWRPVVSSDDEIEAFDEMYDPVEHLLDHILEHSNAQVACAADDDLACLFKGQAFPEDLESALETLAPRVIVDEHGVVESLPVDRQLARQLAYICDASHSGSLLECNPDLVPPPSSLLGEDMDDAQSDDEDSVLWSLAQQKLAALTDPNRHSTLGLLTQQQQVNGKDQDQDPTIATNPLTHPYNLPAPALPIMPRTIRRQMLQTSAGDSWSLQRNSMWEGQVSRTNLAAQRAGGGLCNSAWMEFASALNQNWSRRDISDLSPSHIWPSDHDVSSTAALTMDHTLDPLFPTSSFLGEDQLGSTSPDGFLLSANNIHEPLPQFKQPRLRTPRIAIP